MMSHTKRETARLNSQNFEVINCRTNKWASRRMVADESLCIKTFSTRKSWVRKHSGTNPCKSITLYTRRNSVWIISAG